MSTTEIASRCTVVLRARSVLIRFPGSGPGLLRGAEAEVAASAFVFPRDQNDLWTLYLVFESFTSHYR